MFQVGDRVKHAKEFIDSIKHRCVDNPAKLAWLEGEGTVKARLGQNLLRILWDCDVTETEVSLDNVWFTGICGDSFYYDERPGALLVGFCKMTKGHLEECVPTVLK